MQWYFWLALGVLAAVGEALTLSLVLASVSIAAISTAIVATAAGWPAQIAVFFVVALVLIFAVRPAALRVLPALEASRESPQIGPTGALAIAVEPIDQRRGQIRVGRGEFYSARSAEPDLVIASGREVEIVRMEGLTALVRPLAEPPRPPVDAQNPYGLSAREIEVLRLVAAGMSNAEIAQRLVVSPRTVHHHVSHIFDKMGVDSRVDAARLAIQHGLAGTEET